MKFTWLNEAGSIWIFLVTLTILAIGIILLRVRAAKKEAKAKQKNQWNKLLETKNFIVEFDEINTKYRVRFFSDNEFVDECIFTPYDYHCPEGCPGTLSKYDF